MEGKYVVVKTSSITCDHTGSISVSSPAQSKLKVSGEPVLIKTDFLAPVAVGNTCTNVDNPNTGALKCTTTTPPLAGEAAKLKVNQVPVLLDDLSGKTVGTDPTILPDMVPSYSVQSVAQNKLKAI